MEAEVVRRLLIAEMERLQALRAAILATSVPGAPEPAPEDAGTELLAQELTDSLVHELHADVQEVVEALRRLDAGHYGRCEHCGQPIGDERLEAVPAARWCVVHEASRELELAVVRPVLETSGALEGPEPDDEDEELEEVLTAEEAAIHRRVRPVELLT